MVNEKSHDFDRTVTSLPVLIPTEDQGDGDIIFQDGIRTRTQAVKRFVPKDGPMPTGKQAKRFVAISKMQVLALGKGKKIDYALFKEVFRSVMEDAFKPSVSDEFSAKGFKNLKSFSRRWLPATFNQETKSVGVVMWWPASEFAPVPAIYCRDAGTAIFIALLFSGIRACLGCPRIFTPEQPNQLYHDRRCADRHRKRRERGK